MNKEIKLTIISAILFAIGFFIEQPYVKLSVFAVSYLIVGIPVIKLAFLNLKNGQLFDENFLMMIATVGAFIIGEYAEAVAVMLFYHVGEIFQDKAVGKSRDSIKELMDIAPTFANLKTEDGYDKVDPYDVSVGDIIVIKPGEKVPLDCVVTEGSSMVDTKALTGESVPITVAKGEELMSGYIVVDKVCSDEDFGFGGKCIQPKKSTRKIHHEICKSIHSCCGICSSSTCYIDAFDFETTFPSVVVSCVDIPCNFVSLRTCNQRSVELFLRDWCEQQGWDFGQRK